VTPRIRTRGYGIKRAARRAAERIDRVYARTLGFMKPSGERRSVVVVGIYRDAEPIASVVDELRASRHDVSFRLGAMAEAPERLREQTALSSMRGGKFQNLNALTEGLETPDWLVIVDDDVTVPGGFLDAAIELCERLDLALAQPAQTRHSNANWNLTKQRFLTVARQTDFVEVGPVTLVRADAQRLLLPFPSDLRYGWGLDFHWAHIMKDAGLRLGILDALAVVHASRKVASTYSWDAAQEEGRAYLATVPHVPTTVAEGVGVARHRLVPRARG
jgi:hypothetical protein